MSTPIRYIGLERAPDFIQAQIRARFGESIGPGDIHSGIVEVRGAFHNGNGGFVWEADVTGPQGAEPVQFFESSVARGHYATANAVARGDLPLPPDRRALRRP